MPAPAELPKPSALLRAYQQGKGDSTPLALVVVGPSSCCLATTARPSRPDKWSPVHLVRGNP